MSPSAASQRNEPSPTAPMPGDDLIAEPHFSNDRSRVIKAPAEQIWPWLAQMGFGRAGWYSWDIIDNFGRRSATELHPEWMVERAGDQMPGGPIDFTAHIVEPPRTLVLALLDQRLLRWSIDFTLAYELRPSGPGQTLLATRARARVDGPAGAPFARRILGPGDGFMVRKQLAGIATRAERTTA